MIYLICALLIVIASAGWLWERAALAKARAELSQCQASLTALRAVATWPDKEIGVLKVEIAKLLAELDQCKDTEVIRQRLQALFS